MVGKYDASTHTGDVAKLRLVNIILVVIRIRGHSNLTSKIRIRIRGTTKILKTTLAGAVLALTAPNISKYPWELGTFI
jgi:hypothetical protein